MERLQQQGCASDSTELRYYGTRQRDRMQYRRIMLCVCSSCSSHSDNNNNNNGDTHLQQHEQADAALSSQPYRGLAERQRTTGCRTCDV